MVILRKRAKARKESPYPDHKSRVALLRGMATASARLNLRPTTSRQGTAFKRIAMKTEQTRRLAALLTVFARREPADGLSRRRDVQIYRDRSASIPFARFSADSSRKPTRQSSFVILNCFKWATKLPNWSGSFGALPELASAMRRAKLI